MAEVMNRFNIIMIALIVLLLADLAVFGVVVFSNNRPEPVVSSNVIRMGVVSDVDHPKAHQVFVDFFRKFGQQPDFTVIPCYAASYDEAVAGFIHGSIDLLLINSAYFLTLKEKYNAKAIVRQRFSASEKEYNHAVLLAGSKITDLSVTRGLRLVYKDRYAMGGYLVPDHYIQTQLGVPEQQWFKSIRFTGSDYTSLDDLIAGRADVIAVNLRTLGNNELYRQNARNFNMFWISQQLPESVICVSFQSDFFVNADLLQRLTNALWTLSRQDTNFNSTSMSFEPIDFQFEGELKKLEEYLHSTKP